MAQLILQPMSLSPNWNWSGSVAYLRIFASQAFYDTDGNYVAQGTVTDRNSFCQEYTCTITNEIVTIPQVTLATTTDSTVPNAQYTAVLYDSSNRRRYTLLANFVVDPDFLEEFLVPSVVVSGAGTSVANADYVYSGTSVSKNYYNIDGQANDIDAYAIAWNGTYWNIFDSVGAVLYRSAETVTTPDEVVTWSAVTGSAPVPTVTANEEVVTATWEQLTLTNQGYGSVVPWPNPGTFWTSQQTQDYISNLVGDGTTPYATSIVSGKTRLSQDPAVSTQPTAVSINDTVWTQINETYWLSDYASLTAALAAIGSTQARLKITQQCTVSSNTTIPSTTLIDIDVEGSFTVNSGVTLTIGSMIPIAPYQVFFGDGNTVFSKNATGGQFRIEWWAGVANSGDCTHAFNQVELSWANGTADLLVGPGVWKQDGVTIPSGCAVIGSGRGPDITTGTVFKPYSTSAITVFTISGGSRSQSIRDCTISTDGTLSASSKCVDQITNVTSAFQFALDNVHLHSTVASSTLWTVTDSGPNYEIVGVCANNCFFTVPTSGKGFHPNSINTTFLLSNCVFSTSAGATDFYIQTAGWIRVIGLDARGPGSFASTTTLNRSITGSVSGNVLTLTSGAFVQNDVGQEFVRGAITAQITGLLSSTTASVNTASAAGDGALSIYRYVPSTSMARAVFHIVGDHNTIQCDGYADEGFQYFLINDASTNVSPMTFNGMTIQSTVDINAACVLTFNNCALKSQTFTDAAAITGSLFFNGCSWDKTAVTLVTGGLQSIELTEPRVFAVHDGDTKVYTDTSFHEGLQKQFFETQTEFLDRRDGSTTPLAVFASASNTDQAAIRIGRLNFYTWTLDHYYDITRDAAVDGYLQFTGSQAFPNRGYQFDANVEAVTFKGGVTTPAQITSNQNNYTPADSSYLLALSTDASRNITGLYFTVEPKAGELHEILNAGSFNIVIVDQSGLSNANARFDCDTGADLTMFPGERVLLTYQGAGASGRWRASKLNITGLTSNGTTLVSTIPAQFDNNAEVGGNLTVSGAVDIDGAVDMSAGLTMSSGSDITFTGTTGQPKILLTDNLANALAVAESSNDYLRFVTTNSSEALHVLKPLLQISPTAGIGYGTGAGNAASQGSGSGKATTVVVNGMTVAITMDNASLNAATSVSFTLTNTSILGVTDQLVVTRQSGGTAGAYTYEGIATGSGSGTITIRNVTGGALGEAVVIRVTIFRAASS